MKRLPRRIDTLPGSLLSDKVAVKPLGAIMDEAADLFSMKDGVVLLTSGAGVQGRMSAEVLAQ
jgi:hypothetical protein